MKRFALIELENASTRMSREEMRATQDGAVSTDCVLNCLAYLGTQDASFYEYTLYCYYGYPPGLNGGVNQEDLISLAACGSCDVTCMDPTLKAQGLSPSQYTGSMAVNNCSGIFCLWGKPYQYYPIVNLFALFQQKSMYMM
jgi:hypothetical protein